MASIDIIEELCKNTDADSVPKIDPNTQSPVKDTVQNPDIRSAVIPVVLIGFYKNTRNGEDAAKLMHEGGNKATLEYLFGDEKSNIIKSVSNYSGVSETYAESEMKNTVSSIKDVLIKENISEDGVAVSNFFTDQRSNILKHLPVELNMGKLMNDSSIDDRTNKMEGPMSGLMHTIEKVFSSTK